MLDDLGIAYNPQHVIETASSALMLSYRLLRLVINLTAITGMRIHPVAGAERRDTEAKEDA